MQLAPRLGLQKTIVRKLYRKRLNMLLRTISRQMRHGKRWNFACPELPLSIHRTRISILSYSDRLMINIRWALAAGCNSVLHLRIMMRILGSVIRIIWTYAGQGLVLGEMFMVN